MRLSVLFGLLCCGALALAGCSGSSIAGKPLLLHAHSSHAAKSAAKPDFPTDAATPAASSAPAPARGAASSGGTGNPGCVPGADYCDTFGNPSSGWPVENPAHFYAQYDNYLGGTYRMGERTNAAVAEDAPFRVTDAANDYSVQVDVDAVLGSGFGSGNAIGIDCWDHQIQGGGGLTSAFLLQIGTSTAEIGLWDNGDASYHEIASAPAPGVLTDGRNHLTAMCIQGTQDGGAAARLSLAVNGKQLVSATYAKSNRNYMWDVGEGVGLMAIGAGSDVFYDNFAVTGKCRGDYC